MFLVFERFKRKAIDGSGLQGRFRVAEMSFFKFVDDE
jgi:hypothetical protein